MKTILYAAFCGTGKTRVCDNSKYNIIELECWKYEGKHFPRNYITDIKSKIGKVKYILISTNPVVLKELNKTGIEINLVYPQIELKEEYLLRYRKRKSAKEFITLLGDNWDDWINELKEQKYCKHIVLESGEFLSDILNRIRGKENELLENTFWELRRIYQNGVAWSDNGIPFRDVMERFIENWNSLIEAETLEEHAIRFTNYIEGANTPAWEKMIKESYKEWISEHGKYPNQ